MSNSKFDNHPIPLWMKDCERKRLADSLTSVLQQVSDDWDIQDSHKAVSAFEKWAYHLIDMDKLGTRRAFDKEMAFNFQVLVSPTASKETALGDNEIAVA